jgi:hypothetical protein
MTKPKWASRHLSSGDESCAENVVSRHCDEPRPTQDCGKTTSRVSTRRREGVSFRRIRRLARFAAVLSLVTLTAGCPWDEAESAIRDGAEHIPKELPARESPPLKMPPIFDQGFTLAQQQLEKFMQQLEDGTFLEKRVKSAACSAMRAAHERSDPKDEQEWENRIYAYMPEPPNDRTQRRVVDSAVHNVASRLSMSGSDYYPVYLRVCGPF